MNLRQTRGTCCGSAGAGGGQGSGAQGSGRRGSPLCGQAGRVTQLGAEIRHAGEEATTPFLEALKAYSLGVKTKLCEREHSCRCPSYQRAWYLDPSFAMAYSWIGSLYSTLNRSGEGRRICTQGLRAAGEGSERERSSSRGLLPLLRRASWRAAQTDELLPANLPKRRPGLPNWDTFPPVLGNWEKAFGRISSGAAPGSK